ncbi:MAG TPA: hypothetical protein PLU87_15170 [Sedimentisphaerales bacterium]|nr:hypothetical protein [Sedimentisphaerales bacterium]HRS12391.1 hypothetical protein [Sedimentisphaerales bacterium]HRV48967.1 hypothetical protein [Sedimentisphaerales bacterium]
MYAQIRKQVLRGLVAGILLSGQISSAGTNVSPEQLEKNRDAATEQFQAWQEAMFQQRQEIARKQLRLFYQNMKVPPPLPPSAHDGAALGDDDPPMTRIDIPLPLPTGTQLTMWVGEASATFQVAVEGKAMSFVGASYVAGITYSASDNQWLVGDAADFRLGMDTGPAEVTGTYQCHASRWTPLGAQQSQSKPAGLELSADLWKLKGSLGYNTNNELSVGLGADLLKTPKALDWVAKASVGVQGQVSAPVKFGGLTQDPRSLSAALSNQIAKVVQLLTEPVPCPHCQAKGELDCATCNNTRTVTCTQCKGQLQVACTRCEGGGELYCPRCRGETTVACGSCGGSGQLRCSSCGGRGHVTVYESETQSRQVRRLVSAGFDENGDPFEEWGYETEYYTVQVPTQQTCSSCGGTGQGGTCSRCDGSGKVLCGRCGGTGIVVCSKCGGSGQLKCSKCRGTGKIPCPDCHGKAIRCPMCKGKQQLGK